MVHPAVGRIAFLLEPGGLKVHWITTGGGDPAGLPADNAVEEPANRRGPGPLPLEPGRWNSLRLGLDAGRVLIDLNGRRIYERLHEPVAGRQFGLFHYKDETAVQIRQVALRGNWPEHLSARELADLTAVDPDAPQGEPIRRVRHALIGEPAFALQAGDVIDRARARTHREAYSILADWVLPSPDHPVFRLVGVFTPSFPAAVGGDLESGPTAPTARGSGRGNRLQDGGEIRAPALELVSTAKALNQLDELATRVERLKVEEDDNRADNERGKLALLALIGIARGDDAAAAQAIAAMKPFVDQLPPDFAQWMLWPELTLATQAVARPALRPGAVALLEALRQRVRRTPPAAAMNGTTVGGAWERQVENILARAALQAEADRAGGRPASAFGNDLDLPPWSRVNYTRAETRGRGYPITQWTSRDGTIRHFPGHEIDLMYLNVPLRGDFQLDCELSLAEERKVGIGYAGLAVVPRADLRGLDRWHFGRSLSALSLDPPAAARRDWIPYRLVVKAGSMTSFIDSRPAQEVPAPAGRDPWLMILCEAMQSGAARKITITGDPRIPERLDLSAPPDLGGWLPDDDAQVPAGNPDWDKRGEEVVGRLLEDAPGSKLESLLHYHRPMLEDGRITYEFYYDPGSVMVHPALDRLVFLIEPDGLRIHQVTDGADEQSGLAPDQTLEEPANRRGPASLPLRPHAWNRLMLSLAGNRVKLDLNDQGIYERSLEPTNQRFFGLFHYADETMARVRRVSYQGQWPRSLPTNLQSGRRR